MRLTTAQKWQPSPNTLRFTLHNDIARHTHSWQGCTQGTEYDYWLHINECQQGRNEGGEQFPGHWITMGVPKSPNNVTTHKYFLQYSTVASKRPWVRTGGAKFASWLGRQLTLLHLWMSEELDEATAAKIHNWVTTKKTLAITKLLISEPLVCWSSPTVFLTARYVWLVTKMTSSFCKSTDFNTVFVPAKQNGKFKLIQSVVFSVPPAVWIEFYKIIQCLHQ